MAYPEIRCEDRWGEEISKADLEAWFGAPIEIKRAHVVPGAPIVRVVKLKAKDSGAQQFARMLHEDGSPWPKAAIGRWWAGAPELPQFPANCLASRHAERADIATAKDNGFADWAMGPDDKPPSSGVWPIHCPAPADGVWGLGWTPGGDNQGGGHKTIEVTFQQFAADPTDPEDPGNGDGDGQLKRIADALELIASKL